MNGRAHSRSLLEYLNDVGASVLARAGGAQLRSPVLLLGIRPLEVCQRLSIISYARLH